jgi:superfamily II DNA/RNA helicase
VLFGWHRAVYDVWLDKVAEFKPVLYTGSESANQKGAALDAFKNGDSRVLIMSLRSGSGVDSLQMVFKVAVFGELDWSPQVHEQGIGRLRRDGIGEPPVAYFLVFEEGSDPAIAEVLQVKRQQGEQLVSPDGRLFENATAEVNRTRLLAEAAIARAAGR